MEFLNQNIGSVSLRMSSLQSTSTTTRLHYDIIFYRPVLVFSPRLICNMIGCSDGKWLCSSSCRWALFVNWLPADVCFLLSTCPLRCPRPSRTSMSCPGWVKSISSSLGQAGWKPPGNSVATWISWAPRWLKDKLAKPSLSQSISSCK